MADPLTARQQQLLDFIQEYTDEHKMPPTLLEMMEEMEIRSKGSISKHLNALVRKRQIVRGKNSPRNIRILEPDEGLTSDDSTHTFSIIAPPPLSQARHLRKKIDGAFSMDVSQFVSYDPDDCIVSPTGDDGLSKSGILRGDLLLIEICDSDALVKDELVAVLTGARRGRILARRFHKTESGFELYGEGSRFPVLTEAKCHLIGRILTVVRPILPPGS